MGCPGAPPGRVVPGPPRDRLSWGVPGRPGAPAGQMSRRPPGTPPGQLSRGPPGTPRDAPRTLSRGPPGTLKFAILGVWPVSFSAFSQGFGTVFQNRRGSRKPSLGPNPCFFWCLLCWLRCHAFRFNSHAYTNQETAIPDFLPAPGFLPICASRPVFSLSTLGVFVSIFGFPLRLGRSLPTKPFAGSVLDVAFENLRVLT